MRSHPLDIWHSLATLLAATLLLQTPALAQLSFGAQSGQPATTLVDEQTVLDNVRSAFDVASGDLFVNAEMTDAQRERARRVINEATRDFHREARLELNELKGDGVLGADEVTEALSDLRHTYLDRIERALDAIAAGYPPPPVHDAYSSPTAYARAVALYTFDVRNDPGDWLLLALAILAGLFLAWLSNLGLRYLARRLRGTGHRWLAELTEAASGPLYLVLVALALRVGFDWLWIPGVADEWIGHFTNVTAIVALFWFTWQACEVLARGLAWLVQKTYHATIDEHMVLVISRALRVVALGIFVLLLVKGVLDSNLTGLIAGLGVLGVVLSFLMRGTIENIAASFTIFGDKPFRVGDLVVFDDQWGKIEDIGFRSTRFRTLKGHLFTIPNSKLVDDAIHNVGARPSIRRRFRIGLTYDTPPEKIEQAMQILRELLDGHRGQPKNQPARVAFEAYGEHSLLLLVQYYYEPADYWEALGFDTELNLEINRRFAEAGIAFAFPTHTVHLHDPDGDFSLDGSRSTRDSTLDSLPRDDAEANSEDRQTGEASEAA